MDLPGIISQSQALSSLKELLDLRSQCNEWLLAAVDAMNDGCWYAIVRSEKTHTLARNEFQVLMCHHAVRKDTHAGLQRMLRHAMNYWPATNSKCWCAIMRSEKTHTLACNKCFGMQWITGPQRIPSADVPTCGQKRHTRWPDRILRHAMNYGCGSAIVTWIQASKHKNITI